MPRHIKGHVQLGDTEPISTAQHITVQQGAAQHGTGYSAAVSETAAQQGTAQHGTAQRAQGGDGVAIASNLTGVKTDLELRSVLDSNRHRTVFVDFGSALCTHCRSVLPHFLAASRTRLQQQFVVASVDYMLIEAEDIKWTPTVAVYKRGVKVDAFKLSDAQRMQDHVWLHDDDD